MLPVDSTQAFNNHWLLWSVLGVHKPRENTIWHRYYTIYRIAYFSFFIVFIPMTAFVQPFISTSLAAVCEALGIAVPGFFELLKLAIVWRVRGHLQQTHGIFRQLDKRLKTLHEREIIRKAIKRGNRIFFFLFSMLLLLLVTGMVYSLLSNELIFPIWVPWNWRASQRIYIITALMILLGFFGAIVLTLNNDTFPVSYLTMVAAHIDALRKRILDIGHDSRLTQSEQHQQLIETIQDHQLILELVDLMQSALSLTFFLQFFCTAISQCAVIFFLAFVKTSLARTINMFFLMMAITNETLLTTYAVEVLNQAGEKFSISIYSANWLDQSTSFRRDLLFMLMRSQRTTTITAAGLIDVRASTMITVFKGAYSMFTLLNDVS